MLRLPDCCDGRGSWGELADETPLAKGVSERDASLRFWATLWAGGSGEPSGDRAAAVIVEGWASEEMVASGTGRAMGRVDGRVVVDGTRVVRTGFTACLHRQALVGGMVQRVETDHHRTRRRVIMRGGKPDDQPRDY
jgi:hypothetical protein